MSYDSEEWRDGANCASTDPDIFFPPVGQPGVEAKKICAACDVRVQCLEYAMSHGERIGIWGGISARRFHDLGQVS